MANDAQAVERMEERRARVLRAVALAGVLALALGLRLIGLRWGLPDETHLFSYHPDEFHSLRGAISMALGDLNPHFFNYGSLYLYLVGIAAAIGDPGRFSALAEAAPGGPLLPMAIRDWTLLARIVTVLLAVGTVATVYGIAREIWSHRAGLLAASALSVMPLHVLHSHYGTVDVPGAFFTALTLLFAVRLLREPGVRNAVLAGAAAGLAASTKYSGGVAIIAPVAAWLVLWWRSREGEREAPPWRILFIQPVAAAIAFALTSPFTFLDWSAAWRDISFEMAHMRAGDDPWMIALWPNGWLFHAHGLFAAAGALTLVAAAVGVATGLKHGRGGLVPMIVFGAVAFAMIGAAQVRYARYEMPLLPVIAVLAGGIASTDYLRMWRRGPGWSMRRAYRGTVVFAVAVLLVALAQCAFVLSLPGETPHDRGLQVLEERLAEDATVGLLTEPWFSHPPVDYCNGGVALRSNPLWAAYRAPRWALTILEYDPGRLQEHRPDVVVVTSHEVPASWIRAESVPMFVAPPGAGQEIARAQEFMRHLTQSGYRLVWRSEDPPLLPGSERRPVASDWRYPFPAIAIWSRDRRM